jgi:hypothetical protein
MANTACFIIVGRNDIPIYEAEVGSAAKVHFFLHFLYLYESESLKFIVHVPAVLLRSGSSSFFLT